MWNLVLFITCFFGYGTCKDVGHMTVNGKEVPSDGTTQNGYDRFGTYDFYEGQPANISCFTSNHNVGFIELSTKINGNRISSGVRTVSQINKYVKLTGDYNDAVIDCHIRNYNGIQPLQIGISLKLTEKPNILGFQVNGLDLAPISNIGQEEEQYLLYQYDYFDGEQLTVQSVNHDYYENITCHGKNLPDDLSKYREPQLVNAVNSTTTVKNNQNMDLTCLTTDKQSHKSLQVTLKLVPSVFDYYPYIKGLSMANFIDKTRIGKLTYIRYEYDEDKHFKLECYSKKSGPKWINNNSEVALIGHSPNNYDQNNNKFTVYGSFILNVAFNRANISCVSPPDEKSLKDITTVQLIRKKVNQGTTETAYYSSTTEDSATTSSTPTNTGGSVSAEMRMRMIIVAACMAILVVIVLLTLITIYKRKRKQESQQPDPTSITYENLSGSKKEESQYAAPSDSIEPVYMQPHVPTTEEMYSKIIPKSQRKELFEDPAYASVGELGPTYSQVLPKSIRPGLSYVQVLPRGGNTSSSQESDRANAKKVSAENPYAELIHKNSPRAEVIRSENPYAEIRPASENPYSEPTGLNNYENVFDNQQYVNSNANGDYAEPAYCEVNICKK